MTVSILLQAQNSSYREMHKVKKGETIFGIAKKYGITIEALIQANPDMNAVGYELKKGDYIFIPYQKNPTMSAAQKGTAKPAIAALTQKATGPVVKVGVMLPLHNVDGDGRRMLEYYRGMLMGCDQFRKEGINVDVRAWNVPIDANIMNTLNEEGADKCDIIFGPLYSAQVPALSAFTKSHGIKLVIPFSITGKDVDTNPNIFRVYQDEPFFYGEVTKQFLFRFSGSHVVVIDCNDRQTGKGVFTSTLRKALSEKGMTCSITNLTNSDENFAKAFNRYKQNIVVLNTARSPELNAAIAKLDRLKAAAPSTIITLFGYTEWLMYAKYNMEKFCRYDTYIPTHFYYNPLSTATKNFESDYQKRFGQPMMDYMPRFALTGYDHSLYFLRGIKNKGKKFDGADNDKTALQTQLHFRRTGGSNSGLQNVDLMFVHYNTNRSISIINF